MIVRTEIMTKHQVDKSDDKEPLFANAGFKQRPVLQHFSKKIWSSQPKASLFAIESEVPLLVCEGRSSFDNLFWIFLNKDLQKYHNNGHIRLKKKRNLHVDACELFLEKS